MTLTRLAQARRGARWLLGLLAIALLLALLASPAREPQLEITNQSVVPMVLAVDGERVRILRGGTTEFLELPVAVWASPRQIEVYAYPDGPRLLTMWADLNDLADQRWRLRIP